MYKQHGALTAHLLASFVWKSTIIGHFVHLNGMAPSQPHLPASTFEGRTTSTQPPSPWTQPPAPSSRETAGTSSYTRHMRRRCVTRPMLGALTRSQRSQGSASDAHSCVVLSLYPTNVSQLPTFLALSLRNKASDAHSCVATVEHGRSWAHSPGPSVTRAQRPQLTLVSR
jgi:hypothetical protein